MSYPINYPTPQGANVQIFGADSNSAWNRNSATWIKPQGASFVWFTLIGTGGAGDGTTGGGSGAVTNFMCPAFLIPDSLQIQVYGGGVSGGSTQVFYQQKDGSGYSLLQAANGSAGIAGSAMTANYFTAMGFFQSVAGQNGSGSNVTASATTFLSGGGSSAGNQTSNYGYSAKTNDAGGFFQMQPIIVGAGGMGTGKGGIGCGAGLQGSKGGDGLVVIITW